MSSRGGHRGHRGHRGKGAKIMDRLDELLSARIDDELTPDERAELEALLASDPDSAARALALEEVDVQLRSFAKASVDEDRLATTYDELCARLAIGGSNESDGVTFPRRQPYDVGRRKKLLGEPMVPILLAAAAALILYVVVPTGRTGPTGPTTPTAPPSTVGEFEGIDEGLGDAIADAEPALDSGLEDELILVLGYGDEMSELQGITRDDLDVIEQLELLDFLSDRELSDRERALDGFGGFGERGERG